MCAQPFAPRVGNEQAFHPLTPAVPDPFALVFDTGEKGQKRGGGKSGGVAGGTKRERFGHNGESESKRIERENESLGKCFL